MSFQKKCPAGTNKIMTMVEGGMGTDEIAIALREMAELKELESVEGVTKIESFPDEIRIISQALAFRDIDMECDIDNCTDVLAAAYIEEVHGIERFREGDAISRDQLKDLCDDKSYRWLIVEAPNGQGVEADGAILGVSCFSTDGTSRRNGEVEGKLGCIRLFGTLPRYHGLCIGNRLLKRTEKVMYEQGCCRSMVCIPSTRKSMSGWIQRRGYTPVGSVKYPDNIGHRILKKVNGREDENELMLLMYSKQLLKVESSKNEKNSSTDALTNDKNTQNISMSGNNGTSCTGNGVTINHARVEKDDFDGSVEKDDPERNVPADGLNQMKNKQNMSLPPHWREIQPNATENNRNIDDDDDDDENNKNRVTISSDQTTTTSITDFSKDANKSVDLNADSIVSDTSGDSSAKKNVPRTYVIFENLDEDCEHLELD